MNREIDDYINTEAKKYFSFGDFCQDKPEGKEAHSIIEHKTLLTGFYFIYSLFIR